MIRGRVLELAAGAAWRFLVVVLVAAALSCGTPSGGRTAPPPPGTTTPLDCTVEAIGNVGPLALPQIDSLLAGGISSCDAACEARVASLIAAYGVNVVGCMIRGQAKAYAEAAVKDPADVTSSTARDRAREIIRQRGWVFTSP